MKKKNSLEAQIILANCEVLAAGMHDIARLPEKFTKLADLLRIQMCMEDQSDSTTFDYV